MVEHGMTALTYLPVVLLCGNGQFRRGKLQTHIDRFYLSKGWDWGQSFHFPITCMQPQFLYLFSYYSVH